MIEYIQDGKAWLAIAILYLIGLVMGFVRNVCVKKLQKESLRINNTKNTYLKHIKLKYENICKLEKNVYNSQSFVEKNLMETRCCGINLYTMKYINRICNVMIIYLGIFFAGYAYFEGTELRSDIVGLYGMGSVAMSISLILLELVWMPDIRLKRTLINISSYLDNHREKCHINMPTLEPVQIKPQTDYKEKDVPVSSNDEIKLIYERDATDNKLIEEILREYLC